MSYAIESIAKSIGARRVGKHKATIDWLLTEPLFEFSGRNSFFCFNYQTK